MCDKPHNFQAIIPQTTSISEPLVYLVSYPRSGNTLLRNYLSCILGTGYYSVYKTDGIEFDRKLFTPDWDKILAIKDHTFEPSYQNVIYIIRDGRDSVLSLAHYTYLTNRHNFTKREELSKFLSFLKNSYRFGFWSDHVREALNLSLSRNVHFVKYSDLLANPQKQLALIMRFLGKNISADKIDIAITLTQKNIDYKKNREWGFASLPPKDSFFNILATNRGGSNWKAIFDDESKKAFHNLGGTEMLLQFGFENDPDWWKR